MTQFSPQKRCARNEIAILCQRLEVQAMISNNLTNALVFSEQPVISHKFMGNRFSITYWRPHAFSESEIHLFATKAGFHTEQFRKSVEMIFDFLFIFQAQNGGMDTESMLRNLCSGTWRIVQDYSELSCEVVSFVLYLLHPMVHCEPCSLDKIRQQYNLRSESYGRMSFQHLVHSLAPTAQLTLLQEPKFFQFAEHFSNLLHPPSQKWKNNEYNQRMLVPLLNFTLQMRNKLLREGREELVVYVAAYVSDVPDHACENLSNGYATTFSSHTIFRWLRQHDYHWFLLEEELKKLGIKDPVCLRTRRDPFDKQKYRHYEFRLSCHDFVPNDRCC